MKICNLLIYLAFFAFQTLPTHAHEAADYTVIEDKNNLRILDPALAGRKTMKIKLSNGLEAYLISDPSAELSGAALTVQTGSWEDDPEYPGIAHFLEHMLFLGTKKYPKESEFDLFLNDHGGETNASTSTDRTMFIFSVGNDAFPEALDRFASFFKEPLFNPSGVAREMHAIDQEFAKDIQNDDFRQWYVLKELGNPQHPNSRFNIGNSQTLQKVSRGTLIEWYKENYSANLMKLIVYSPLPLGKLAELVSEDFGDVPNSNRKPFEPVSRTLSDEILGKIIYIVPVKNIKTLSILWELPPKFARMIDSKPNELICQVIGDESQKSLLQSLKKDKLAESVNCESQRISTNVLQMEIDIALTDSGLENINTVIDRVFQTIALLKSKTMPKYIFDEMHEMNTIEYEYQERKKTFDTLEKLGGSILDENFDTFPKQTMILQKFEPGAIAELLKYLTPRNAVFIVEAPPSATGVPPDHKEKWMGVEYSIKSIPEETLKSWAGAAPGPELALPGPNPFIPNHLTLIEHPQAVQREGHLLPLPVSILDSGAGSIYFCPDTRFKDPKVSWQITIKTPQVDFGYASKTVLSDLYVKNLEDALDPYTYPATVAGLNYKIERKDFGIGIAIDGYSEKAGLLLQEILKKLKGLDLTEDKFKIFKEALLQDYQNQSLDSPLKQCSEALKSILYKKYATSKSKAAAIKKISFESCKEFSSQIFKRAYAEAMLYGNLSEEQAKGIADTLISSLDAAPYPKKLQKKYQIILLPEGQGPFYYESKIKAEGNAVLLTVENGPYTFKSRAAQQILMEAMSEPFFNDLRTKQQTGYLVGNEAMDIENHLFSVFVDQTKNYDPRDLLARFELFIEGYLEEMTKGGLPEDRFKALQESFIQKLLHYPENMNDMGKVLYEVAFKYDADFDFLDKRLEGFKQLTYDELTGFARKNLGRHNRQRMAILLVGNLPSDQEFNYKQLNSLTELRKLSTFTTIGP